MPLLGEDMSDEMPTIIGLTLVEGHFTTWVEMHRMNFRCEPEANLLPRVLGGDRDGKELHERWMQWVNDSMFRVLEDNPDATISDMERVVRWVESPRSRSQGAPVMSARGWGRSSQ